jgi:hypothetical protein
MTAKHKTSLIEQGLQTFLHGFSTTRSMTHPYPARQLRPSIWVLADMPRTRGSTRNSEVIVYGAEPEHLALLASKTGALLYPHLGYEQHGELLIFMPRRDAGSSAGGAQG